MAIPKPPCPPNCERRRPACQGHCPDYEPYRKELDERNKKIRETKQNEKRWTEASSKAVKRRSEFKRKLARGVVHR